MEQTHEISKHDLKNWRGHWRDEIDAAFLYDQLAHLESSAERRAILQRLSKIETGHAQRWEQIFRSYNLQEPPPTPSPRVRFLSRLACLVGPRLLMPMLVREEAGEVKAYLALSRRMEGQMARNTALDLAKDSAEHVAMLRGQAPAQGEPWHHTASGDVLRNIVYGFNDGLTANFGLVAGMIGGAVHPEIILLSGLAGAVADALSMGASGYLAAKSQREVYEHEIEMERQEIKLMPELEAEELAFIYESKGLSPEQARQVADHLMANPEQALAEQVREELGISEENGSPLQEGAVTGFATAAGAVIPVLPFLFLAQHAAMLWSFSIAMLAHFGVGGARSFFTGRGIIRSGLDMFLVGFGVAAVSYFFGDVLIRWLLAKG